MITKSVNVATPELAVTVVVPASVPEPVRIAAVTAVELSRVAVFASESRTVTTGCVASTDPLFPPTGWVVIVNVVGVIAVMVTAEGTVPGASGMVTVVSA